MRAPILMKTIKYSLILVMAITLISCKKDKSLDKNSLFEGIWEMKWATNGMSGTTIDLLPGNGNLLILSKNNYQVFSNHQLQKSGTFQIKEEISMLTRTKGNRIIYDNNPDQLRAFVEIKDGKLGLWVDAHDGPSTTYIKKTKID